MRNILLLFALPMLFSCSGTEDSGGGFSVEDASGEIAARAFGFAELYADSDTEYRWGGQDSLRAIGIDCSGLVVMCYKYALVDTKFSLLEPDMTAAFMRENAATIVGAGGLRKGDLIFMGEADSGRVSHVALFERIEGGRIHFIDSTQRDTDGDGLDDIDGVSRRSYEEGDARFKAFGRMRVKY